MKKSGRVWKRWGSWMLCLVLLSGFLPARAAENSAIGKDAYFQSLLGAGFPEEYAEALFGLHITHPSWRFAPLPVTTLSYDLGENYTFEECVWREWGEREERSLVADTKGLFAFRDADAARYDSGLCRASYEAVAYFLDPRNFLCEETLFQFWDLSFSSLPANDAVQRMLADTFLQNTELENGKTAAAFLCEAGEELGVSPLFLASRLRQEQGEAGNALAHGRGGEVLLRWKRENVQQEDGKSILTPAVSPDEETLSSLNGLYNLFNISASGNGYFEILSSGLQRARTGSPEMAEAWGDAAWDARWKSIYGGALYLKENYIDAFQNTLYLQKWNLDARSRTPQGGSRNFWGQYMQNIGAAFSEGKVLYETLADFGALEEAHSFLIPVFEGMPESPAPDPSDGGSIYSVKNRAALLKNELELPGGETLTAVGNAAVCRAAVSGEGVLKAACFYAEERLPLQALWQGSGGFVPVEGEFFPEELPTGESVLYLRAQTESGAFLPVAKITLVREEALAAGFPLPGQEEKAQPFLFWIPGILFFLAGAVLIVCYTDLFLFHFSLSRPGKGKLRK